jgi:hypothetical protein
MMKQISISLVSAVLLLNALGCSNGNVRAAAPPPPPVVEVAPVIQRMCQFRANGWEHSKASSTRRFSLR